MTNEKELTHIDLFSGIGGFTLAGEWAEFKTIVFCEKEEFCQKVLKKHWPEIPIIKEIRDFNGTKWRNATLLTGGFPCQPFSVAGPRTGKKDDRYLWPEMLRVISEAKPYWILAENVPGIFRMALDTVLELGIDRNGCMKIIRKVGLGIPQKSGCFICPYQRKRQWIDLKKYHPELWEVGINLEKNSTFKHKNFTYVRGMTIEQFVADQDKQEELDFGFVLDQSCHCYFD